jgi:energy-coupling factor transport system permease protein
MLSRIHPLPKLGLCLIWICAALLVFDLRFQLVALALAVGLLWGVERVALWKLLVLMVPFALFGFGFLTTSILFDRSSGFAVQMAREQGSTMPDFYPGVVLFCRVLACGMISALFALTTDPGRLVRALMLHLRLPAAIGLALLQAMHLIPDLGREMQSLRMARVMREGGKLGSIPGPREAFALAIPLLAFAIRRASRAAIAMEARGFQPGRARSQLPQPAMTSSDLAVSFGGIFILAAILLAQ